MALHESRITGIIAEYNPFHNGHLYQMRKARCDAGASWCVVLLSGSFVQRGEAAVYSTRARAEAALRCGADAVFEIPAPFSTSSARDYAGYGIRVLTGLGVSSVSCGTEDASPEELQVLADAADETSGAFRRRLREALRSGLTYPEARMEALAASFREAGAAEGTVARIRSILSKPNNILAFEYARALRESGAQAKLVTTFRKGSGYHDPVLRGSFSSATALRQELLSSGDLSALRAFMPSAAAETFSGTVPLSPDLFCRPVRDRILSLRHEGRDFSEFADVSPDLSDRLNRAELRFSSWESLVSSVKTRQYTHTRISRALTHILLGITDEDLEAWKSDLSSVTARLLGFRKDSEAVLTALKASSSIPIISKAADAPALLGTGSPALRLMEKEAYARDLWNSAFYERYGTRLPDYWREQIVIV